MDNQRLQEIIKASHISVADLSKSIGMDASTLYRKISGDSSFTVQEAKLLSETLKMKKRDLLSVFFAD